VRILFVALAVPYPPNNGHRLRNWGLLKAVAQEGHAASLISFAEPPDFCEDLNPLRAICDSVELVPLPFDRTKRWRELAGRLRTVLSPLPYGALRYRSNQMEAAVEGFLDHQPVDVILCDDIYQFRNIPLGVQSRLLLNKHDLTSVILRRVLAGMRNPLKLAYGWLEYRKLRRWEALVTSRAAGALVASELDGRVLQAIAPGVPMTIAPNAIDVHAYAPGQPGGDKRLLFFGAMDYHANQDAVDFFVSQILPQLKTLVPDVEFVVAGRNPPEWLRKRCERISGVEFTGTVPDIRGEIARAAVCVVPLRIGSGTRLKILEAAAMAKPIVSTRAGAEGLDFVNGEEIILADVPQDFARAVADLMVDPARRQRLGLAARRRVEQKYGIPALRTALRAALEKLVGEGRDPALRDGR
jgi:glycosyltransferase involved in cell wall biosynthesis